MDNLPAGREALGRALQIDPNFSNAAQARAALAEISR
jgi:hypothetical protein